MENVYKHELYNHLIVNLRWTPLYHKLCISMHWAMIGCWLNLVLLEQLLYECIYIAHSVSCTSSRIRWDALVEGLQHTTCLIESSWEVLCLGEVIKIIYNFLSFVDESYSSSNAKEVHTKFVKCEEMALSFFYLLVTIRPWSVSTEF